MGELHGCIDAMVIGSGIPCCILHCSSFMQNFSGLYRPMIRKRRELLLAEGTARSSLIDAGDIGAAAAGVFADPGGHAGRIYDLRGPQALDNSEAMAILSDVTGIAMAYRPITDAQARAAYEKLGLSTWRIEVLESLSRYVRRGHAGTLTQTLETLLGRPPTTFREFAVRHRACWI